MPKSKKRAGRQRLRRVTVEAERRPEVDWDKYAYALLMHARIVMEREAAAKKKSKDAA
jgi:hypothetical protein